MNVNVTTAVHQLLITDTARPRLVGVFTIADAEKVKTTFAMFEQNVVVIAAQINDVTGFVHVNIPDNRRSKNFHFTSPDAAAEGWTNVKIQVGKGNPILVG